MTASGSPYLMEKVVGRQLGNYMNRSIRLIGLVSTAKPGLVILKTLDGTEVRCVFSPNCDVPIPPANRYCEIAGTVRRQTEIAVERPEHFAIPMGESADVKTCIDIIKLQQHPRFRPEVVEPRHMALDSRAEINTQYY